MLIALISRRLSSDEVKNYLALIPSENDRYRIALIIAKRGMRIANPLDFPINISEHIQHFDLSDENRFFVATEAAKQNHLGAASLSDFLINYDLSPPQNGVFLRQMTNHIGLQAMTAMRNVELPKTTLETAVFKILSKREHEEITLMCDDPEENSGKRQKMNLEAPLNVPFFNTQPHPTQHQGKSLMNFLWEKHKPMSN